MAHIYWLEPESIERVSHETSAGKVTVFITAPEPLQLSLVARHIKKLNGAEAHVVVVPGVTKACEEIFQENGTLGDIDLHSWQVYFVPLAPDVLSLNLANGGFEDTYLNGMPTAVKLAADGLQDLQNRFGLAGRIVGKGDQAKLLADLLLHRRKQKRTEIASQSGTDLKTKFFGLGGRGGEPKPADETSADEDGRLLFESKYGNVFVGKTIDNLVIIDRNTDLLTPLLTQLTYEGLIDEYYGITESGSVELPVDIVDAPQQRQGGHAHGSTAPQTKRHMLSASADPLYKQLQDSNFAVVGRKLGTVARQLKSDYDERFQADTVTKISQFVQKLGGLQQVHMSLGFHTRLADELMTKIREEEFNKVLEIQQNLIADSLDTSVIRGMIQDLIDRGTEFSTVIRLLAIECIAKGGIKDKDYVNIKHDILQTYGYHHMLTLRRLEDAGVLCARSNSPPRNLPQLRKQLAVVVDDESGEGENPTDITFAYSGYAPISVRLVQCAVDKKSVLKPRRLGQTAGATSALHASPGWKGAEDILKLIPGAVVDEQQRSELHGREDKLRKILVRNSPGHEKTNTVVFFLGGITYAEIAALRFVSERSETTRIIIATTGIINGAKLVDSAIGTD